MLSPDYLLHISEGAEDIADKLHTEIIKKMVYRIMLRIGRGEDYILTAQDKWAIENLQQAGYLLEDIQKEIAKYTKLQQTEIAEAMEDAGVQALEYDNNVYKSVGLSSLPLIQSPNLIRLVQRNYEATLGEWNNYTRSTIEAVQRNFLYQLDRAYNLISTGAMSYTEAVKEVVDSVVSDGATVKYATGHEDSIETAALRAVRTGIAQATAQIQIKRMDEIGVDLVITSSHLGARPSHQAWQGKVFTLAEMRSTNEGMPAYGTITGLCGINCRHSFSPYFDGMDNPFEQYDSKENIERYEKEQRQRTLERRIRNTKREVIGLKESIDQCKDDKAKFALSMEYQRKCALLAKQSKAYSEYCSSNGLKPLSDRIQIARWDRQQAAAARGAAKRYENAKTSYHGGIPKKWKKIDASNDNAVVNVNPRRQEAGYDMNCPNCACAYELRKRGYDVIARPYVKGGSHYLNRKPWKAWENINPHTVKTERELNEYMQNYENGSRFGIALEYGDKTGHVIVGEIVRNCLKLYDVQTGKSVDSIDFGDVKEVKLWQTNNAVLSDRGITSCEVR